MNPPGRGSMFFMAKMAPRHWAFSPLLPAPRRSLPPTSPLPGPARPGGGAAPGAGLRAGHPREPGPAVLQAVAAAPPGGGREGARAGLRPLQGRARPAGACGGGGRHGPAGARGRLRAGLCAGGPAGSGGRDWKWPGLP